MSRDAFPSYDPQDPREPSANRQVRPSRSFPPVRATIRKREPERTFLANAADTRELAEPRDTQSAAERDLYVRDRAYRLRDPEIHSMKEMSNFRVIRARRRLMQCA